MSNNGKEMLNLARELWRNFLEKRVAETQKSVVRYYRAEVVAPAENGTITVQRPFEEKTLTLSYVSSMAAAKAGEQVVVLVFGNGKNLANHKIFMYPDGRNL
jgi:hypothetical protein